MAKCPQVCLTSGDRRRLEDGGGSRWCMEEDGRMWTSVPGLQSPPAHTGTNMVTICAWCKQITHTFRGDRWRFSDVSVNLLSFQHKEGVIQTLYLFLNMCMKNHILAFFMVISLRGPTPTREPIFFCRLLKKK